MEDFQLSSEFPGYFGQASQDPTRRVRYQPRAHEAPQTAPRAAVLYPTVYCGRFGPEGIRGRGPGRQSIGPRQQHTKTPVVE